MKKFLTPLIFVTLFVIVQSLYYKNNFVFIYDQVSSSTKAMEIWREKKLTLIGPPLSLKVANREIYFGGISYYIQLFFLLIGNFDPFWSTYAFMIFAGLMIVPLFFGVKKLVNQQAATAAAIIYSLFPFYIESTRTFWNPYFQFSLLPLFIWLMALFKEKRNKIVFFILSLLAGILFQLHYQFLLVTAGLIIYYFGVKKLPVIYLLIFICGILAGFANMILFEIRHNFYLTQTVILYFRSPRQLLNHWFSDYYLLSPSFFVIIILLNRFKNRIKFGFNLAVFIFLFITALYWTTIAARNKNYPPGWYYHDELEVYRIIKNNLSQVKDFNVFAFYDATGNVQKYFFKRDKIQINFDDYYHNQYLYVIYRNDRYFDDLAL